MQNKHENENAASQKRELCSSDVVLVQTISKHFIKWRRDIEAELKQQGTNWSGMTRAAQKRVRWRGVVDGLCSTGSDGHM